MIVPPVPEALNLSTGAATAERSRQRFRTDRWGRSRRFRTRRARVGNPYARPTGKAVDSSMTVTLKDFYADWCGPCKTQDPILEEIEDDRGDSFEVEKINVDEEQDVANEYQVRSLPTLIVENDDGIVERFVGVTQRDDIESALDQAGA
ncbi:thioredoxin family protein [Natronoarchaeum rubrum]|uniref:thioredoxin family protein n=1 Tax=Natronoarchaeum rubrum TaxID=755311 RepID=UPI00211103B3|nr:thioredoxin domain-containing protein [Natronoarchaeum rubrum]